MKYLIIGNGPAGIAAAEKIRKLDSIGEITIITSEKYSVYSKCLLPDFLSGQVSEERMFIREKNFNEMLNIKVYYNYKVESIDFISKCVLAENNDDSSGAGAAFTYDKLLIATGSAQTTPPIKGLDSTNTYFLSTLDEAKKIIRDSRDARRVIIIGAGFVGLEAAFNLYKSGKEVTIIERTPRVLMNVLDEKASEIIQDSVQEEGIRLILNANVSKISNTVYSKLSKVLTGRNTHSIVLEDDRRFKADMIIVSTGSRPNLDFIKNSGIKINRGIVVDKYMQTSIEDVYASGDVVESIDAITGKVSLSPIWPNAVIQGETAGSNMAGIKQEFSSLISMQNASEFREIPMISMGITVAPLTEYEELIDSRPSETVYRKIVLKDNIIVGMIFLGDIKNAGVIGALMKNKINVEKIKGNMLNPNFGYSEVSLLT